MHAEGGKNLPEEYLGAGFDPIAARVGAATQQLVARLTTAEHLLRVAPRARESIKPTDLEKQAARILGPRKRDQIEADVRRVLDECPQMTLDALDRFVEAMEAQGEASGAKDDYPISVEETGAMVKFLLDKEVADQMARSLSKYEGDHAAVVHIHATFRWAAAESAVEVQGRALLPLVVTYIEEFLGAMVRTGLAKYPRGLGEPGDIPFEVFERYQGHDSVERFVRDQSVSRFLRGSPEDWSRKLRAWSRFDPSELGGCWETVQEAVARRHVLVHNAGVADAKYVDSMRASRFSGASEGDTLSCPLDYTARVLRDGHVLGVGFALRWARFLGVDSPLTMLPDLIVYIYKLEEAGDWESALVLARLAIGGSSSAEEDEAKSDLLRVNWWLCRQHLGETVDDEARAWSPVDPEMIAARAALLKDYALLATTISKLRANRKVLDMRSLHDQIIFKEAMAASPVVRQAFHGSVRPRHRPKGNR